MGPSFPTQGGDIGSIIARIMSSQYDSCKAININYLPLLPPLASNVPAEALTERETRNVDKAFEFIKSGRGYGVMQGTRPGTIGMVIQSSPIALLAWCESRTCPAADQRSRTRRSGGKVPRLDGRRPLSRRRSRDGHDVVDPRIVPESDLRLRGGTSPPTFSGPRPPVSQWFQLVTGAGAWHRDPSLHLTKPFGYSSFGKEIASAPEVWAKQTGNLQFYRYHEQVRHPPSPPSVCPLTRSYSAGRTLCSAGAAGGVRRGHARLLQIDLSPLISFVCVPLCKSLDITFTLHMYAIFRIPLMSRTEPNH